MQLWDCEELINLFHVSSSLCHRPRNYNLSQLVWTLLELSTRNFELVLFHFAESLPSDESCALCLFMDPHAHNQVFENDFFNKIWFKVMLFWVKIYENFAAVKNRCQIPTQNVNILSYFDLKPTTGSCWISIWNWRINLFVCLLKGHCTSTLSICVYVCLILY